MKPKQRQEALISHLVRQPSMTVAELAQALQASRRTILRDIGALREDGYQIDSESGPGGGLRLQANSIHTNIRLSVTEIFAMLISIESLRAAGDLPFLRQAEQGFEKIKRSLPPKKLADLRKLLGNLYIGTLGENVRQDNVGPVDEQVLAVFEQGFLQLHMMRFTYLDAKAKQSHRQVEPQALLILPPLWYLVGWDLERNDIRHFRMDRITHPKAIPEQSFLRRHVQFTKDVKPISHG